jgi:hypothetical protein
LPAVVDPVLKTAYPLTPDVPPSAVRSKRLPLDFAVPVPVTRLICPPVLVDDSPALKYNSPPTSDPDPTDTYMEPPLPVVAEPDPTYKAPELPLDVEPVLRTINPLTPEAPAFNVCSTSCPLLLADPDPDWIITLPPEFVEELPAFNTKAPP